MKAIAEAAGKEPKIVLYDPAAVDIEKGKGFHFRCALVALRTLCWLSGSGAGLVHLPTDVCGVNLMSAAIVQPSLFSFESGPSAHLGHRLTPKLPSYSGHLQLKHALNVGPITSSPRLTRRNGNWGGTLSTTS